jgi:hypothetical protein
MDRTPLLLAVVLTLLNAVKPLHMDDSAYFHYATQIARSPLDPYGFTSNWFDPPRPAMHVLAPPVLPAWWAAAINLFGPRPLLWKLWLFPFCWMFTWSLADLMRRFGRGLEAPFTSFIALSPALLPSINFMLDVPALALNLAAIAVFARASDRGSMRLTALAGLLAGLAMQTKYTGLLAPAVVLLYGICFRQLRLALLATGIAAAIFAGWEAFLVLRYGESHFLYHAWMSQASGKMSAKLGLLLPLLTNLGGVAPFVAVLGLAALRWRQRTVLIVATLVLSGFALLALLPPRYGIIIWHDAGQREHLGLRHVMFALYFTLLGTTLALIMSRLLRRRGRDRVSVFLTLWLVLEIAGYFTLSPFPAVRRLLGIFVVLTFLVQRLAARTCRASERGGLVRKVVTMGIALGLLYYAVDLHDARVYRRAAERSAQAIVDHDPTARVWYTGHWGFEFYAERAGMLPVFVDESPLQQGDWLVVPDGRCARQDFIVDPLCLELVDTLEQPAYLPLQTVSCYYGGRTPIESASGPRLTVDIYRVLKDHVPRSLIADPATASHQCATRQSPKKLSNR